MSIYDDYYKTENLFGEPYKELVAFFKKYPLKGKLLDIGCGQGRNAIPLAKIGYQVTEIDIAKFGIELTPWDLVKPAETQTFPYQTTNPKVLPVVIWYAAQIWWSQPLPKAVVPPRAYWIY